MTKRSTWDPWTRKIKYDKDLVAQRLRYWAKQYRKRDSNNGNDLKDAAYLEEIAENVEEGIHPPANGAKHVITYADSFEDDESKGSC